ncbi:MAG TPA: tetratricopeptide repeat protein [Pyrinomonadaceae bacterium]|nr:tetratricopeptide repeat protein [Pyrinomonadaceae bacterium]
MTRPWTTKQGVRAVRRVLAALCLLYVVSPAATATAAKDGWVGVRSPHYLLVGDTTESEIREVAIRFEQFRKAFSQLFPASGLSSSVPTTVVVFKDFDSYKQYRPLYQGRPTEFISYFQSGLDINYIALPLDRDRESLYVKLFHESVHLLLDSRARRIPDWLNEGLAQYFSTFEFDLAANKNILGKPVAGNLALLRKNRLLPLANLFAVDRASADYNESERNGIFNAQSWALVHYLLTADNGRRQLQLLRFIELTAAGAPFEKSFRQSFKVGYETMEEELREYVRRENYRVRNTQLEDHLSVVAELESLSLTSADAHYFLGDLLLHINRYDDAARELQKAIALNPGSAIAHASLGMVRVRQRQGAEARRLLRHATSLEPDNYLTHYYYAYALSREEMGEEQEITAYEAGAAQTMRHALRRAIALKPGFTESYRLLAFINLVTGEQLPEAVELLRQGLKLSPGRPDLTFILAQVYLRMKETDAARATLQQLLNSGANARLRARAQTLLDRMKTEGATR